MATDVLMPQMGESIAEGTIVKWLKKVGDTVQRDEPLLEISTDKVDAEIPAPAAGGLDEGLAKGGGVGREAGVGGVGGAGEGGAGVSGAAAAGAAPAPSPPTAGEVAPAREEPAIETRPGVGPPAQADGDSRPLPSQVPTLPQPQAAPPQPPVTPQARAMPQAPPAPAPEAAGRAGEGGGRAFGSQNCARPGRQSRRVLGPGPGRTRHKRRHSNFHRTAQGRARRACSRAGRSGACPTRSRAVSHSGAGARSTR